jgi:hypothetical protein
VIPGVNLPRAPLRVSGTAGIDSITGLSKLTIDAATIKVSSALQLGLDGSALIQKGTDGFWHLKTPREEIPAWVTFSLKSPAPVKVLRIFPRTGLTSQLWNGSTAFLEGSADGQNWQVLAALGLDRDKLTNDWISFALNLTASFSHYRLSVYDLKFLSLGRLELYTTAVNAPGPAMSGNVTLKTE